MSTNNAIVNLEKFIKEAEENGQEVSPDVLLALEVLKNKISDNDLTIEKLRKMLFGKKSEKTKDLKKEDSNFIPGLFPEISSEEKKRLEAEVKKEQEKIKITYERNKRNNRGVLDVDKLPVKEDILEPEFDGNKSDYELVGQSVTEKIVHKKEEIYILRIIRPKYVLKSEIQIKEPERKVWLEHKLPPFFLHKSMASNSLLADLLIKKYMYHLPFERIRKLYKESGLNLPSSTINDWYINSSKKLKILYEHLRQKILQSSYVQVDETILPVINHNKNRASKEYVWCVRDAIHGSVFFNYYKGSRSQEAALNTLKGFKGIVQADGYNVYESLSEQGRFTLVGCWAHARRKFIEARDAKDELAKEALVYINSLYGIEKTAKAKGLGVDEICHLRQKDSLPIIKDLYAWCDSVLNKVSKHSPLGKALLYLIPRKTYLMYYLSDGRIEIDNNSAERAIRPIPMGRKNYLFCGNPQSAMNTCMMYSFIESCKANDIEPREWLINVMDRIAEYEDRDVPVNVLEELLPMNWK